MSCSYRETREALEPCFIFCVKMNLESAQPSPTYRKNSYGKHGDMKVSFPL